MAADTEIAEPQAAPPDEAAPAQPKAAKQKGKQKGKEKEPKSKKKPKRSGSEASAEGSGLSIAAHPRAARAVARAKGWGGLAGFVVGGYLALPTNTLVGAGLHALIAGVACYVTVWAGAVFLWRHLVVAELRGRQQQLLQIELARLQGANPTVSQGPVNPAERSRAGASW
jgi:hypothetical protein